MRFSIYFLLFACLVKGRFNLVTAIGRNTDEKCSFENTVNLTNVEKYENDSYLYREVLIPPEKQSFYDYDVKFLNAKYLVPVHLRGCVCDKQPCIKMCCTENEYFNDAQNISSCEAITPDMDVLWDVFIELNNKTTYEVNAFQYFTIQFGLPCQYPEALNLTLDGWILQENGTVYVEVDNSRLGTLDYCFSPYFDDNFGRYILTPFSCPIKNVASWKILLNTYAMASSVLFLIPTIAVYLMLKELRGNLRGKLLISYLSAMTIGYSIISFINISNIRFGFIACSLLGYTCYFFFMATFLWLSVLCFDIWMNFKETNIETHSRKHHKQFIIYSLYTWSSAGIATGILIYVQFSPYIEDIYKPGIGVELCWLNTGKWSAAAYFYGPNLLILLLNLITFVHFTAKIYNVRRDLARMTHKEKFFQENAIVILRLFLIMGIQWIFDILSYCVREYKDWQFLFVISDFANAIQGIFIFSLFILKPNVINLLKKRFCNTQIGRQRRSVSSATTNFTKLQRSFT